MRHSYFRSTYIGYRIFGCLVVVYLYFLLSVKYAFVKNITFLVKPKYLQGFVSVCYTTTFKKEKWHSDLTGFNYKKHKRYEILIFSYNHKITTL